MKLRDLLGGALPHHCSLKAIDECYRGVVRVPCVDFILQECKILGYLLVND